MRKGIALGYSKHETKYFVVGTCFAFNYLSYLEELLFFIGVLIWFQLMKRASSMRPRELIRLSHYLMSARLFRSLLNLRSLGLPKTGRGLSILKYSMLLCA